MLTPRARFQGPFSGANKGQNLAGHYPVSDYQNVLILHLYSGAPIVSLSPKFYNEKDEKGQISDQKS